MLCFLFYSFSGFAKTWQDSQDIRKAVIRIQVISQEPNVQNPWKMLPPSPSSGTGFYIGKGRVLTNAHVVEHAQFVSIQRDGDSHIEPATIRFVGHDCDLAILEIEKQDFFTGVSPLEFGDMPDLHSSVFVVGYPIGGSELSITEGIVSRLEYHPYVHSEKAHLIMQVDAAINPGNSGGPVLQGNKVVGVAFGHFQGASGISYAIPLPIIQRFLKDIQDGSYQGHPEDGLFVQSEILDNPSAHYFYDLPKDTEGVLINQIAWYAPTFSLLQPGDILLAIDGKSIGNDGLISFAKERVDFRVWFDMKQIGETVSFQVWRKGKKQSVVVPITLAHSHIPTGPQYEENLSYLLLGGLLFTELSEEYLNLFGSNWVETAPLLLRYLYLYHPYIEKLQKKQSIIIVSQKLPAPMNQSWDVSPGQVVKQMNGVPISNLLDLQKVFYQGTEEVIVLEFWGKENPLILSRSKVMKVNQKIAELYGIPKEFFIPLSEKSQVAIQEKHTSEKRPL